MARVLLPFITSIVIGIAAAPAYAVVRDVPIGIASNFSEPSSSSSNPYGDYFRDGVNLALKESSKRLADHGLKVVLKEFDYGNEQYRVLDAAKKSAASDVIAVMGYNFSSHALLAAPIHQESKLPMLTPSATADRLGQMGSYVHQACFDNGFMGQVLAAVAVERLHAKKAAIVVDADCAYCQDLSNGFDREFLSRGGKITAKSEVLESDHDFVGTISDLRSKDFDVVLIPNQELSSARIISALLKAGIKKPFLGGDGWGDVGAEFFSVLENQQFNGYSVSHWHPAMKERRSVAFVSAYTKAFGKAPNDTSVLAYDTMNLLIESILRARTLTRAGMEESLNSIKKFEGVTGEALFRKGRAPKKSLVLLAAKGGAFEVIKTIAPENGGKGD